MDRLVKQLSKGKHHIAFEPRSEQYSEIKERLTEMRYVFVKFLETQGETELGINIDDTLTNLENADFINGIGDIRVVGTCELNYHKVRCIAEVDLATKQGTAYLEIIGE